MDFQVSEGGRMTRISAGLKALATVGGMLLVSACAYPSEPRYSIYADAATAPTYAPPPPTYGPAPTGEGVRGATDPARESAPPLTAPVDSIEGGALDAPAPATPAPAYAGTPAAGPASEGFSSPPPPASGLSAPAGASYTIQPGDTISGVGRRFQTPVQTLIDLNGLGPRAEISPGRTLVLPASAVDIGGDPYATGPSPLGVTVAGGGTPPPPPPPPPSGNAPLPAAPAVPTVTTTMLDWPVRGDILRRFGPGGVGERNNGINIGAPGGADVKASAAGTVGYVGDDLAGQGLTVLVVHRDGWRTVYGHLGSTTVRDGDTVRAGQTLGTVGTTAGDGRPSIHYETWRMSGDEPRAIDPLTVLPR